jgi:acyl dehydratase
LLIVETPAAMESYVGKSLGVSEWLVIDQKMIDGFADATGDHQWIHVDVERARKELTGGKTLAHGYLLLSLLPRMMSEIVRIEKRTRALNYGSNKVRYILPVPAGARVRLGVTLQAVDTMAGGRRFTFSTALEMEGAEKPAMIAEVVTVSYD